MPQFCIGGRLAGRCDDLREDVVSSETVFSRFVSTASAYPGHPFLNVLPETAVLYGIAAGEITYAQMLDRVQARQAALRAAGVGTGTRIGLLLENRPDFIEIWFAANGLGASVVPINPDLRRSELEYLIGHSEMAAAFILPHRLEEVAAAARSAGSALMAVTPQDRLPALAGGKGEATPPDRDTEAALLYTSGTTGAPKGCVLTNEYFLHSGDWYRDVGGLISLQPGQERMLTPLPVFHMNAMAVSVLAMVTLGGCLTVLDRFHPGTWWDAVRQSRATCLHYLGVMPSILMKAPPADADRAHSVRFGFGAGVPRELHGPFEERFGFPLIEAWAMTETGSGGVICASREPRKIGSHCFGRPTEAVEIRLVDDQDNEVGTDVPGELLVRRAGANPRYGFFKEYLKNPEATAEAWAGGWFHTGDIVSRDADGDLHFVDRKKNVIRRSGENIAAVEVESILARHPLIKQAAVAATPDALRGDEVAALIVLQGAGEGDQTVAEEIARWGLGQMAYYKVPGWIAFVRDLPKTPTEKILRAALKTLVAEKMAAGQFLDTRALKKRQA
ncbi:MULTISPECIES: AMP-binding protein [unclassified Azospirillum]|uniref:AMP-binding protein n=1 Tax=unclassified Azospirillum TaxID=2630922 RepID=UPI000B65825E|nr:MULTISPECIES: AMP-binding protein [unclassified Azospirillum]SNS66755.1 Acyl-CoA synthetase (AMP-forming)/AMP-acid ligase II [Azospirillum sp. RU38E]SNS84999.1 Acyl-CoA synthetase (AMP-forming)/AMP-acid ligase II [Azospirillum sp. RU37A]